VAYVQAGRLHVVMDDGAEEEFGPGDIMMLPPGHDAWTVGDEPCIFVEFTAGTNYYAGWQRRQQAAAVRSALPLRAQGGWTWR
jgi:ethanolamine utilization protein EutQ (cupin superfamily)